MNPLRFAFGKVKNGLRHAAAWGLNRQARRAFAQKGILGLSAGRRAGAKPPVWSDLWFLYMAVTVLKPKVILEFGSGCSTIAMAQALADNAAKGSPGMLYSLDADPKWGQVTIDSMPDHLRELVDLRITPADPIDYEGTPAWRHREVPDVTPDLVYLDGPALEPGRKVAVDVLDLEPRLPVGVRIVVDGRMRNVEFMDRHLTRKVRRKHNSFLKNTVYEVLA